MTKAILARAADSVLVIIDIQERLAAAMDPEARAAVVRNTRLLLETARLLAVPVLVTEQYPRGLGHSSPEILELLPEGSPVLEKTAFACTGSEEFLEALDATRRRQVIIAGMEAHVCVLQSVMELLHLRLDVFVAADACTSRAASNHANAMERMRAAGAVITNTESVMFEWLRDSRHEHFKAVSKLIR